jgi:hypothetical protein
MAAALRLVRNFLGESYDRFTAGQLRALIRDKVNC